MEGRTGSLKEVSWEREGRALKGHSPATMERYIFWPGPSRDGKWPAKSKISSTLPIKSVIFLTRFIILRKIYLEKVIWEPFANSSFIYKYIIIFVV